MGYTVEFVRVAPEELDGIGLAMLLRSGDKTVIYCNADHIGEPLARSLSEQGTRFSAGTIRRNEPVSEPNHVRFERADPEDMPDGIGPHITYLDGLEAVAYMRADMITAPMAYVLQEICAEETKYFERLAVIGTPVPAAAGPASAGHGRRGPGRRPLAGVGGPGTPRAAADRPADDPSAEAERLLAALFNRNNWGSDPYNADAIYARIRQLAPVLRTSDGTLVLTRFADCLDALRNPVLGKSDDGIGHRRGTEHAEEVMSRWRHTILFSNPPEHTRHRKLLSNVFTPRHVEAMRPRIAAMVARYLDRLEARPGADFMSAVALPFPAEVIAQLLGIPGKEYEQYAPAVREMVNLFEPVARPELVARGITAQEVLENYLGGLLEEKRRSPGSDLLSRLVESRDADALSDPEMTATAMLLFAAGFETTANLLGNGLHALVTNPEQMRILRQRPDLVPAAVEEFLRYEAPVQMTSRTALQPCVAGGTEIPAGQLVLLMLGAGNRDPAKYTKPDELDVTRDEGACLSFASGIHFCIGAHLARLESAEFFTQLLARFARLELAGPPVRRTGRSLRGYAELPVIATAR